jgi:hypothetical protein
VALICVLVVKVMLLAYAGYTTVRARFYPGIGALATMLYLTTAHLLGALPDGPKIPLAEALAETWWIYPCAALALSFGPMVFAFYRTHLLREDDPKHAQMESVAFAFLANVLLDTAVLVIIAVALLLVARDP